MRSRFKFTSGIVARRPALPKKNAKVEHDPISATGVAVLARSGIPLLFEMAENPYSPNPEAETRSSDVASRVAVRSKWGPLVKKTNHMVLKRGAF